MKMLLSPISFAALFLFFHTLSLAGVCNSADPCKEESPDFYEPMKPEDPDVRDQIDEEKYLNLEKSSQKFVLESKELIIPGFPNAFNPSVVRWQDKILLCYRIRTTKTTHQIGFAWVDENFELISKPSILNLPHNPITSFCKQQDPRLITLGDRLYMIYSNIIPGIKFLQVRRVFITEIHLDGEEFCADFPECIQKFENENEARWEKNWTPFVYHDQLLLSYSITPHRVFQITGPNSCDTIASTLGLVHWNWGFIRGGTTALLDGNHYLSFFHSSKSMKTVHSKGKSIPHYVMGAFTFSSEPPFEIRQISPEPIIGRNFYSAPPYKTWKPLRVIFPGGFIMDDKYIWIVYGRQDFESWVVKIDKQGLMDSLIPVPTILK